MSESMHVRLKAYNRKKGHVLQRYTYRGIRFQAGRGWYRVDPAVAEYLREVHQIPDDEDSPLAFDVCTEDEARAIDEREARAARQVLPAEEAMDVTSRRERSAAAMARRPRMRRADEAVATAPVRSSDEPRDIRREQQPRGDESAVPARSREELTPAFSALDGAHNAEERPWEEPDAARDDDASDDESYAGSEPSPVPHIFDDEPDEGEGEVDDIEDDAENSVEDSTLTTAALPAPRGKHRKRRKTR